MNSNTKGFILVFISAFSFALLPIFGKIAYALGIGPFKLLAWRFILAAAALWLSVPFLVGQQIKVRPVLLFHFVVQGIIGYGLASIGYFNALTYLDASLVSILLYTYPALVAILARLIFKEHLSKVRLGTIALTFAGSFLVTNLLQSDPGQINWHGILFGLQAALAYSVFNLYSQKTTAETHPLVVSTYAVTAMAVFFSLLTPKQELFVVNWPLLGIALVIGIVSTVIPIITYLSGIKLIGASKSAIISTFEPAFTIILAFLFLGESLSLTQSLGAVLIFAGVMALQLEKKPVQNGPELLTTGEKGNSTLDGI